MKSEWDILIGLLEYAIGVEKTRCLMVRYHTNWSEEDKDNMNKGMERSAHEQWHTAKKMYCSNKDMFDAIAKQEGISRKELDTFHAMRDVIEQEMRDELEKQILKEDV